MKQIQIWHNSSGQFYPPPVKFTLIKALDNNQLTTWTWLDTKLFSKHIMKSINTAKGHLDKEPQKLQSTWQRKNARNTGQDTILITQEKGWQKIRRCAKCRYCTRYLSIILCTQNKN